VKFISLIGLPGSGKSTFVRNALTAQTIHQGAEILSTDDLIEAWGKEQGMNYSEAFRSCDFSTFEKQMRANFQTAIAEGRDIVVDRTNLTTKSRRSFLASLPAAYRREARVFQVPEDVLAQRLHERAERTGKFIPPHVVSGMRETYQEPVLSEGFDLIELHKGT
jgi:predicted kinase